MNPTLELCKKNAAVQGGVLCPDMHCSEQVIKNYTHELCTCSGRFEIYKINGKCLWEVGSAIPVAAGNCFCCCGTGGHTAVSLAEGQAKDIKDLNTGDEIYVATSTELDNWNTRPVQFSSGIGEAVPAIMVIYQRPDGETGTLLASPNQPILLANQKLSFAKDLETDKSYICLHDNTIGKVVFARPSQENSVHHFMATSTEPTVDLNGHLFSCNGVVCADYAVQLAIETKMSGSESLLNS